MQIQVEGYRAKSTQHLDDATSLFIDHQTTLTGPLDIRNSANVQRAFVGYNHQLFADRPVRLQWFAGVGWTRTQWTSITQAAQPQTYRWDLSGAGPAGGVLGAWQINPLLALEAAAFGGLGGWSGQDSVDWAQTELGLALTFAAPVRLRLGWADRSLRAAPKDDWHADFTADARGPYVKLAFEFR